MEQGVVMISMHQANGTHCGIARVRYMGDYAEVNVRWSGQPRDDLEIFLLTDKGIRAVVDGRTPHESDEILYGVAAMNSSGSCICCGAVKGQEAAFENAMLRLRMLRSRAGFPGITTGKGRRQQHLHPQAKLYRYLNVASHMSSRVIATCRQQGRPCYPGRGQFCLRNRACRCRDLK